MANVTCRSCGRRYDYSQHDCCPDCGAYNRPPRHEQVDADGTVRHLTDADYAKRKSAALGKVCFEEKECHEEKVCFEDEARNRRGSDDRDGIRRKARAIMVIIVIVPICLTAALIFGVVNEIRGQERRTEYPTVTVEPVDEIPVPAAQGTTFTAQDGSTLRLLDWWQEDDAIAVELDADFADSDHEFYATLECADADGNEVMLDEFEDEYDDTIVLHFFTDDETLTPRGLVVEEWDEHELVATWWAGLEPER